MLSSFYNNIRYPRDIRSWSPFFTVFVGFVGPSTRSYQVNGYNKTSVKVQYSSGDISRWLNAVPSARQHPQRRPNDTRIAMDHVVHNPTFQIIPKSTKGRIWFTPPDIFMRASRFTHRYVNHINIIYSSGSPSLRSYGFHLSIWQKNAWNTILCLLRAWIIFGTSQITHSPPPVPLT